MWWQSDWRRWLKLRGADDVSGLAKGIAFRLSENLGVLRRDSAADEIKALDQTARAQLRKYGLRFGAFNVFFPSLLKPAAADLLLTLWCLKYAGDNGLDPENLPDAPRAGLTSVPADPAIPDSFYQVYGFHVCGPRVVRIDILERLADQIRPLLSWRPSEEKPEPPRGATGTGAFTLTPEMMSILGCSAEELGDVLRSLGFRSERRPVEKPKAPAETETQDRAEKAAASSVTGPGAEQRATGDGADAAEEAAAAENQTATVEPAGHDDASTQPHAGDEVSTSDQASPTGAEEGIDAAAVAGSPDEHSGEPAALAKPEAASAATANEESATKTDDPSTSSSSETPTTAEADADTDTDAFIEVWRPKRRNEGGNRRGRRGSGGRRHGSGSRSSAEQASSNGDEAASQAADGGKAKRQARDGKSGRSGGRGPRHENRRRGGDRRRDDRKPSIHTSSPQNKRGGVDPDSPFAALSALRKTMDDGDRG